MKKLFSLMMVILMIMTSSAAFASVDATSSATTWVEETPATPAPTTPATPAIPETPTTTPAEPVTAEMLTHVVVKGDVMWQIAITHKMTLNQLLALNPQIKNADLIEVGQVIIVKAGVATTPTTPTTPVAVTSTKVYQGLGQTFAFRVGPGKDASGNQVYSFNIAMAQATFDANGRIISVYVDGVEVATPNYDGASMPHFSGWPGKEGYPIAEHDTGVVTGTSVQTNETAVAEVAAWQTKRERGDTYHMNPDNEWYEQMDFFQEYFVGKTVAELEAWFAKNTTAAGRPIKADTTNEGDMAKYAKLTDAEKAALADVVTGATMSIRDAHGDFLGAVAEAYKNRVEVTIPIK